MSAEISRDEVVRVLQERGFENVDKKPRAYAESWLHAGSGELINVKKNDSYPLVLHPAHESRFARLIDTTGVARGRKRYSFNSNYHGFPPKKNRGERAERHGIDLGFESTAALGAFLDELLDQGSRTAKVAFDTEAMRFLDGFMALDNPQFTYWLPRYQQTLQVVRDAVARNAPEDLFERIWKSRDNAVSNAGRGRMGHDEADRNRDRLVQLTAHIAADGSPEGYAAAIARFEQWRDDRHISNVYRLLVARAFAAIHPERYHTTVDATKQERIIPWFVEHTGFIAPEGNWATRAAALSAHLEHCGVFGDQLEQRNMFPWYVFEQMRDASGKVPFRKGHTPRPATGQGERSAQTLAISYRHNLMQDLLVAVLREQHGEDAVGTEHPTGTGGRADAVVQRSDGRLDLYEIKVAVRAADAVREAIGQLLEYAYRRGGLEPATLYVVAEPALDAITAEFLSRLNTEFGLKLEYFQLVGVDPAGVA